MGAKRGSFMVDGKVVWLNCCAGCVFSKETYGHIGSTRRCRRQPPTGDYQWPRVGHDDWCGEFKQKDGDDGRG